VGFGFHTSYWMSWDVVVSCTPDPGMHQLNLFSWVIYKAQKACPSFIWLDWLKCVLCTHGLITELYMLFWKEGSGSDLFCSACAKMCSIVLQQDKLLQQMACHMHSLLYAMRVPMQSVLAHLLLMLTRQ